MRILPFTDPSFDWDRFESFCLSVVRSLPEVKRADRYGKTGEAQAGIDIEADLRDGRKRTVQCRHRKTITKPQLEKLVAETTFTADEHEVWITGKVGTPGSDYMLGLDGWTIQSAEGISQTVRLELPRERARLIVQDAFGAAVRRAFLGPNGPVGFVAPEDFFAPFDDPSRLLRHDLALVGRADELDGLVRAVEDPASKVVVLLGRGGIGKTRLLRESASRLSASGSRVLFAATAASLTAELVDDLPLERTFVFVDDAHRTDVDLAALLAASLRRHDLTVILGARPAGVDAIRAVCSAVGIEGAQLVRLPRLTKLAAHEVELLAASALDEKSARGQRLADATEYLPMLTVLGGRMLARGDFESDAQNGDAAFRAAVLECFAAEQRGRVSDRVPPEQARRLMALVAALNPLNSGDVGLIDAIAGELSVPASQVRRWLGDLEDAGLILTRGDLRRLTPDILADQVLYEACLDPQGRPTGYAVELWRRYSPHAPTQLLASVGELDWRTAEDSDPLLADVWDVIIAEFRAGDAWARQQLIDTIAPAAYFWPQQVVALVDVALDTAAASTDWGLADVQIDDRSVRNRLPVLLRAVGAHPAHAREAMDRLWVLARDDRRETNAFPEHPLRALAELGGYDSGPEQRDALLDLVERRLAEPDVDEHFNSPLPLVEAVLSREGTSTRSSGVAVHFRPYFIDPAKTRPWRERVRAILGEQALTDSPRRRALAAKVFDDALRQPMGYFNATVPTAIADAWHDDQMAILDTIEQIAERSDDALVRVLLRQAIDWHAAHSRWEDVSARAQAIMAVLAGEAEETAASIASPWDLHDESEKTARDQRVAARLAAAHPTGPGLAEGVEELLHRIAASTAFGHPDPGHVLFQLFEQSPAHARGLFDWVVRHPEARVATAGAVALTCLRSSGEDVDDQLTAALASDDVVLRRLAADYLSRGAWFEDPTAVELRLLDEMATDDDEFVRSITATTALRMRAVDPAIAMRAALTARIEPGDGRTAETHFSTIDDYGVNSLNDQDVATVVARLTSVSDLGYFGNKLLTSLGSEHPERVVDIWLARLRHEASGDEARYSAVPGHDFGMEMLGDRTGPERAALHIRLLDGAAELPASPFLRASSVYWRLAVPGLSDDEPNDELIAQRAEEIDSALAGVRHFVTAAGADAELVATVLALMPWQVLISRPLWVADLLTAAPHDRIETLAVSLRDCAVFGAHSRTLGKDSPRWSATRASAEAALAVLPPGPAADIYGDLLRWAERELRDDRAEDAAEGEGWS